MSANSLLTLQGPGAYDAAVHCASVSAARRNLQSQSLISQSSTASSSTSSSAFSSLGSSSGASSSGSLSRYGSDADYLSRNVLSSGPRTPSASTVNAAGRPEAFCCPKFPLFRRMVTAGKRLIGGISMPEKASGVWRPQIMEG